ncbi:MAG: acetoacetate decarboxylase family protein [Armatimonadetes bacterium]|nr:acetoacetate decarboxylase family protein [Armatimonadota bacterium]
MDSGRKTEARAKGAGHSEHILHRDLFEGFTYVPAVLSDGVGTEKPFYCYDAEVVILKGLCDAEPIARALEPEGLVPVRRSSGEAMAAIWLNRLRDTVIGPYHEIVVAFDVSLTTRQPGSRDSSPYSLLYPFFQGDIVQYLHTLYITSPLSIQWGREMQAFPKHPRPAHIDFDFGGSRKAFEVRWGERRLMAGKVRVDWGPIPFVRQAVGLFRSFGFYRVANFLLSRAIQVPIRMPAVTRKQYGVGCEHVGHILKGLNPVAVRSWPWGPRDRLELGTGFHADAEPGRESATDLLAEARFRPQVVLYVPSLQMVVTDGAPL